MSVIKYSRPIERIEKQEGIPKLDLSILKKKSSAKTPAGLVLSYAKEFKKKGNLEMTILFQELYKKIIAMETSEKIKILKWRGKSGLSLIEKPDKFICITFKKADKGETPKEIKKEIMKEDLNKLIIVLNSFEDKEKIPTSEIAEKLYHQSWKHEIYGEREKHIALTYMLGILEQKKYIHYSRRGFTTILNQLRLFE
jgi:hypothetical protein